MNKYILILIFVFFGQFLNGQNKFELFEIAESEIDCKYNQNYFELTGKEYFLNASEVKKILGSYDDMVEYSFKGKIKETSISVFEELHLHESYCVLIDSLSGRQFRIRGDIYFSNDRQYFAAFTIGSAGTESNLSIWKVNAWNLEKVYELKSPNFWLDKFCWNESNEFNVKYFIDNEQNIVKLKFID